ncbi:MAG: DUF2807 domain-containing protein [Bacteroidetes bacterium]|nr:MAG: DUF2807 domain-containing protein [Bacteroidota bacterium]
MKNLKKFVLFIGFVLFANILFAQKTQQNREVSNFQKIEISGPFNVRISQDGNEKLSIEANKDIIDNIETEVSNGMLKVRMKNSFKNWKNADNGSMNVQISCKNLEAISGSAAADISSGTIIKNTNFKVNASSAAEIEMSLEVDNLNIDASSGADVNLKGNTQKLSVDISSGADLKAYDLKAENVKVDASSGADAKVFVSKEIDANASSGAEISYKGEPTKEKVKSSSGGDVNRKN